MVKNPPANAGDARDVGSPANAGDARDVGSPANAGDAKDVGSPANAGDTRDVGSRVIFRGGEDLLEKEMVPLQCSCLENPWTEEPGRLQSMELK